MPTLRRFRLWSVPALMPQAPVLPRSRYPHWRRRKARRAVLLGLFCFVMANLALDVALDDLAPQIRDPEYGRRAIRWHNRIAENPTRPAVILLGSSRVSMGVCPTAWEEVRPTGDHVPMLLNMGGAGQGPVGQLLTLRRILAEGPPPDALLIEYWPPFLRDDSIYSEEFRTDPLRLGPVDHPFIKSYYSNADGTLKAMRNFRLNPFMHYRFRLMMQINPRWLKWNQRQEAMWDNFDEWGWLPGVMDDPPGVDHRPKRLQNCWPYYEDLFKNFVIGPQSDRAFREMIGLAREHGIPVGIMVLPESPEFHAWYPPHAVQQSEEFLQKLVRETQVPLIDTRGWMPDNATCDGFHLFRGQAAVFTKKFGPAVMSTFPDLRRREAR